jgi:predicted ATPase/class 3 adenylate cyclase
MAPSECPECSAPVSAAARFCASCGHALEKGSDDSERRQLTVLFCDIVDSTALSERLDPEDWHDLLTSLHDACREGIGRYEGRVSQFLGDGIMAYFGYPIAHEDDAVRAVHAALHIIEDLRLVNQGLGKRLGAELHVRCGLHTGLAVVGDAGASGDRLAIGKSINLAARIQAFAEVDTVVVSDATAQLCTGYFELESLSAQSLRGFSQTVELFRVLRPTEVRSRLEATEPGKLTPYVGRAREIGQLAALWARAEQGASPIVVLRGEAGIGKSRILRQFRAVALEESGRSVELFCSPLTRATAFAPIVDMLETHLVRWAGKNAPAPVRLAVLSDMLGSHSRVGSDALPLMAKALSIPGADESAIQELSPVRRRTRTLEIMRAWLESSSERKPVALLVEDVQWADPSTLDLLDLIARETTSERTLLCVTCRPEFCLRWTGERVTLVELRRLDGAEIEAMITHVARSTLPPLVTRRIAERSEGVPLFVEELTRAVVESGPRLLDGNAQARGGALDAQLMPSTVQGSFIARFDRLGAGKSVAQLAAAIGREFSYTLLSAVAGLPDAELLAQLADLVRSDLVRAHGEHPDTRYSFRHALIQDAIYATLLKSDRARVHERILLTLEQKFPELAAERPEMMAHHAENAGRREAAVPLLRDAGLRAFARTAVAEAARHLSRGLELVDVLDEPARTEMEIELLAAVSPAYMATLGWAAPEVERSCARLRELAASRGDYPRLYQAMWGLWTVHFIRGQLDLAIEVARQAHQMAEQTTDPMLRLTAHHAVGFTHMYRGEYAEAARHARLGLELFDLARERSIVATFMFSSSAALWCFLAQAQLTQGQVGDALESMGELAKLDQALGHAPSRAFTLNIYNSSRLLGELEPIAREVSSLRALCASEGFAFWVLVADILLAWVDVRRGGDAAAASSRMQDSRKLLHGGLARIAEPEFASMHAEALLVAGRPAEALTVAEDVLSFARAGGQRHGEPELYRVQGRAAQALGDAERARALYRRAIASAREMAARLFELRAALDLAELDGLPAMRDELSSILAAFSRAEAQPDHQRARRLLDAAI